MGQTTTTTAGIDTSKDKLDFAVQGKTKTWQVKNIEVGWQKMASTFEEEGVTLVGIEASGGYEQGVVRYLRKRGFIVQVLQPIQVRAYARARLLRAKNDRIDALLIADCAASVAKPREAPDERLEELAADLTLLDQLTDQIARWKTCLEHAGERQRQVIQQVIKNLRQQQMAQIVWIVQALRRHRDLARRLDLILSIPGIGDRTAIAIVIRMPEIGRLSREEAAALAGLAPFDDDSGTHKGQRYIAGGRARLRRSLYAAAWPASSRWNPALMTLYSRLRHVGKAHKLALVACARKLLIYANTIVQRGTPWIVDRQPANALQAPAVVAA